MTDKTIIDGVDVSGCEYLKDNECRCDMQCYHIEDGKCITEPEMVKRESHATYGTCSLNPDCYFKQSARKDERIRELEEKLETKTALLKDAKKAIEKLTIKLQSPLKTKPSDPTEPLCRKLSQIAQHCKNVQSKHSKGNDYMFASEVLKILSQEE